MTAKHREKAKGQPVQAVVSLSSRCAAVARWDLGDTGSPPAVMEPSAQPEPWGLALAPARASAVCAGPAVSQAWQGRLFSVSVVGMAGGAAEAAAEAGNLSGGREQGPPGGTARGRQRSRPRGESPFRHRYLRSRGV